MAASDSEARDEKGRWTASGGPDKPETLVTGEEGDKVSEFVTSRIAPIADDEGIGGSTLSERQDEITQAMSEFDSAHDDVKTKEIEAEEYNAEHGEGSDDASIEQADLAIKVEAVHDALGNYADHLQKLLNHVRDTQTKFGKGLAKAGIGYIKK